MYCPLSHSLSLSLSVMVYSHFFFYMTQQLLRQLTLSLKARKINHSPFPHDNKKKIITCTYAELSVVELAAADWVATGGPEDFEPTTPIRYCFFSSIASGE